MLSRAVFEALNSWLAGESHEPLSSPATVLGAFTDTVQCSHTKNTNRYLHTNLEEMPGWPRFCLQALLFWRTPGLPVLALVFWVTTAKPVRGRFCCKWPVSHSCHSTMLGSWIDKKRTLYAPSHFPTGVISEFSYWLLQKILLLLTLWARTVPFI